MAVTVMNIRPVHVGVGQRFVAVVMLMGPADIPLIMGMPVMLVMGVLVVVLQRIMGVGMTVPFTVEEQDP